jgi:hypothetical protein
MARKTAAESDDDRTQAFIWFARELLFEEIARGVKPAQIAAEVGLEKNQISSILNHAQGFGWATFLKLVPRLRRKHGEFVDEALAWWERKGRRVRADTMAEWAAVSRAAADRAAKSGTSGHRVAVPPDGPSRSTVRPAARNHTPTGARKQKIG